MNQGTTKALAVTLAVIITAGLFFGAIIYVLGLSTVDAGEVGIHTDRGDPVEVYEDPDWYWTMPLTQDVKTVDVKPNTVSYEGNDSIYVITQDGQDVWVDVTVRYTVNPDEAIPFYEQYRTHGQAQDRLIEPTVRSDLRDEASDISTREIITQDGRMALGDAVDEALVENFQGSGLQLEAVQIRGVELNDEYSSQLEQVEIAETRAEQRLVDAEGEAEAERAKAQGDADAAEIRDEQLTDEVLMDKWLDSINDNDKIIVTDGDGTDVILDADTNNNESDD